MGNYFRSRLFTVHRSTCIYLHGKRQVRCRKQGPSRWRARRRAYQLQQKFSSATKKKQRRPLSKEAGVSVTHEPLPRSLRTLPSSNGESWAVTSRTMCRHLLSLPAGAIATPLTISAPPPPPPPPPTTRTCSALWRLRATLSIEAVLRCQACRRRRFLRPRLPCSQTACETTRCFEGRCRRCVPSPIGLQWSFNDGVQTWMDPNLVCTAGSMMLALKNDGLPPSTARQRNAKKDSQLEIVDLRTEPATAPILKRARYQDKSTGTSKKQTNRRLSNVVEEQDGAGSSATNEDSQSIRDQAVLSSPVE